MRKIFEPYAPCYLMFYLPLKYLNVSPFPIDILATLCYTIMNTKIGYYPKPKGFFGKTAHFRRYQMDYTCKTYIEFLYPGAFISESSTCEVRTRDMSNIEVPKNSYGFRFFDVLSAIVNTNGNQVKLTSKRINVSPMYYYGGELYTVTELKLAFPNEHILIGNIEGNGHQRAIKCRTGNWQPFNDGEDILIVVV